MSELNSRIMHKIDTIENWSTQNPVLLNGEIGVARHTDNACEIRVGDGTSNWNSLQPISSASNSGTYGSWNIVGDSETSTAMPTPTNTILSDMDGNPLFVRGKKYKASVYINSVEFEADDGMLSIAVDVGGNEIPMCEIVPISSEYGTTSTKNFLAIVYPPDTEFSSMFVFTSMSILQYDIDVWFEEI